MSADLLLDRVKPKPGECLCACSKKQMSRCNLTVWGEYSAFSVLAHTYAPAVTSAVTNGPLKKKREEEKKKEIQMLMQQVRAAKRALTFWENGSRKTSTLCNYKQNQV